MLWQSQCLCINGCLDDKVVTVINFGIFCMTTDCSVYCMMCLLERLGGVVFLKFSIEKR
jgi:hypothetical protein